MFCSRQIGKTFFKRCFGFSSPLGSFINFSLTFGRAFVCCLVFRLPSINFAACRVPESSAFGIWWLGCVYCVSDVWGLSVFQYAILWYTNIYIWLYDLWWCMRMLYTIHPHPPNLPWWAKLVYWFPACAKVFSADNDRSWQIFWRASESFFKWRCRESPRVSHTPKKDEKPGCTLTNGCVSILNHFLKPFRYR